LAVRWLRLPSFFCLNIVLAAGSLVAYAIFWVYFFAPLPARTVASVAVFASALASAVLLSRPSTSLGTTLRAYLAERDAWLPAALMLSLMIAYLAFLAWPGVTATLRFTIPLPPEDNLIPRYLADRLFYGMFSHGQRPALITTLLFEAQSSDRPPLQAAVLLATRPLGLGAAAEPGDLAGYQVLTTFCQLGWVPALYAVCRSLNLSARQMAFVLIGAAFSGFFLMHSVYTWPKLFAAWLFLTALAIILYVVRGESRATVKVTVAIGVLFALSLLAHGGPFFSIIALPMLVAQRGRWRMFTVRGTLAAAVAGAIVLTPWLAYQKYYDPPGNRLLKYHLAGVIVPDTRSLSEALVDAYRHVGLRGYVSGRWENLKEQWLVFGKSERTHPADWVQWQQFFHHLPALDFLALGLFGLIVRPREPTSDTSDFGIVQVTWYAIGALSLWIILLLTPGSAIIHHGSFATMALLFLCASALAARWPAWLGTSILALHVAAFVAFWLTMRILQHSPQPPVWSPLSGAVMIAGFLTFVWLARPTLHEQPLVAATAPKAARESAS
jgi:hypothetical protein